VTRAASAASRSRSHPQSGDSAAVEPPPNRSRHLRPRDGQLQPTTASELFFELVYVFEVTQVCHLVIDGDLRIGAIGRAAFLMLGVSRS
jgi:hypothetical protein